MAEVTINYKDAAIATMGASGTKTLQTQGKYCEDDIEVVYARPSAPSGTKQINITQNGTTLEDVAAYANAEITVNVQGGGYTIDEIATNSAFYHQNVTLPATVTDIAAGAFYAKQISSISGPNVRTINTKAFTGDAAVGRSPFTFNFPVLETAERFAFSNNDMGNQMAVVTAFTCYGSLFEGCVNLPSVKYTRPTTIEGDQIYNVPTVTTIIINSTPTSISNIAFRRATGLTDIYVPWSEGAVSGAPWGATTATIHYDTIFDANGDPT